MEHDIHLGCLGEYMFHGLINPCIHLIESHHLYNVKIHWELERPIRDSQNSLSLSMSEKLNLTLCYIVF
jgi:hypothetical protein